MWTQTWLYKGTTILGKVMGRCVLSEGTPRCFCSPGFTGPDCTTVVCAPDPNMGVCSSAGIDVKSQSKLPWRGTCTPNSNYKWTAPLDDAEPKTASTSTVPDKTGPGWCVCQKGLGDGPLFVGDKCQHECPNSATKECGGHGKCEQASVAAKAKDKSGKVKTTTHAVCKCKTGYYGAGCQKTCPGTNDIGGLGVCSGHGVCGNADPKLVGHGVGKKCLCNEIGGWYPDSASGGSCGLSCPGASDKVEETVSTAAAAFKDVCNGRGSPTYPVLTFSGTPTELTSGLYQNVPLASRGCKVTDAEPGSCGCDLTKTGSKNKESKENGGTGPKSCAGADYHTAAHFSTTREGNLFSAQQHCTCNNGNDAEVLALLAGPKTGKKTGSAKSVSSTLMSKSSAAEFLKHGKTPSNCIGRASILASDTWKTYNPIEGQSANPSRTDAVPNCETLNPNYYSVQVCYLVPFWA